LQLTSLSVPSLSWQSNGRFLSSDSCEKRAFFRTAEGVVQVDAGSAETPFLSQISRVLSQISYTFVPSLSWQTIVWPHQKMVQITGSVAAPRAVVSNIAPESRAARRRGEQRGSLLARHADLVKVVTSDHAAERGCNPAVYGVLV
jgi:hypothetical protein